MALGRGGVTALIQGKAKGSAAGRLTERSLPQGEMGGPQRTAGSIGTIAKLGQRAEKSLERQEDCGSLEAWVLPWLREGWDKTQGSGTRDTWVLSLFWDRAAVWWVQLEDLGAQTPGFFKSVQGVGSGGFEWEGLGAQMPGYFPTVGER